MLTLAPKQNTAAGKQEQADSRGILLTAAILCCVGIAVLLAAISAFYPQGASPTSFGFNDYCVRVVQEGANCNFVGQRLALKISLACLAIICVTATFFSSKLLKHVRRSVGLEVALCLGLFAFIATCSLFYYSPGTLVASAFISPLIYLAVRSRRQPWFYVMALFLAIAVIPSQLHAIDLSTMQQGLISAIQEHYLLVAGDGDRLAAGQKLFSEVKAVYGQLLPSLAALYQISNHTSLSLGQYMRLVQWCQIAFLSVSALLYLYYARNFRFGALCAVLLIAPWFQPDQIAIWFPNLSAWRLLSFPLAIALIILTRNVPTAWRIASLGGATALFLLANLETGIAILAGYTLSLVYGNDFRPRKSIREITGLFVAAALGVAASVSLFQATFGYCPDLQSYLSTQMQLGGIIESGYTGGFRLTLQPFALIVFAQSCFVLIYTRLRHRTDFRSCLRCCIAGISLVWFSYYVSRPKPWYLCAQYFFFGFFFIDYLLVWARANNRWYVLRFQKILIAAVVLFVVVPECITNYKTAFPLYCESIGALNKCPATRDARKICDLYVADSVARELQLKSDFIKSQSASGFVPYISNYSMLVAYLSGKQSSLPVQVVRFDLCRSSEMDRFVKSLASSQKTLFIDSEESLPVGQPNREETYADLRRRLKAYYDKVDVNSGWERWQLRTGL